MKLFFKAKSVAVIGASRNPNKVGHVIVKNLVESNYHGKVFPINPNAESLLQLKCYNSVLAVKGSIDLAVICVPVELAVQALEECGKKRIRHVVMITAGFAETGHPELEVKLKDVAIKYKIELIGPNVLGVFDAHSGLDTLFLPRLRLNRPKPGGISFICQSGAVGSATLDLVAKQGYGFAKFISYGNALVINECDLIEYLGSDPETKVICLYVEGIKDGKRFMDVCKKVSKKKPIIALKGGITKAGAQAALSHTASLAGAAEVYKAAFQQAGILWADALEDVFDYARVLEKSLRPKGNRVQVITNGGGYGILSVDALEMNKLELAQFHPRSKELLRKSLPPLVGIHNPLDLIGDANTARYAAALNVCLDDPQIDMILLIVLYQTPLVTSDVVDVIKEAWKEQKKPIFVVSTGGDFTELHKRNLEEFGIPCFTFPERAVRAMKMVWNFYQK
ncbi:MAG: CoA-binding protein [Nanoarchaeota archaeon]|nr:CoA-binding protein [Nanoarchaeota archaeon]